MQARVALSRSLVVAATLLAPLVGGAIIYYSLRKTHPRTADFANLMSVAGFAVWYGSWDWPPLDSRPVLFILGALGVIATNLSIRVTRTTDYEPERSGR